MLRTARTTAEMRSAEKYLDTLWDTIDRHFIKHMGRDLHANINNVIKNRELARTLEWRESDHVMATPEEYSEKVATSLSLVTLEGGTERTLIPGKIAPVKEKQKTRSPNTTLFLSTKDTRNESTEDAPITTYTVNKRDSGVLSVLYRQSYEDTAPGEVPWTKFLYAMSSLGFGIQN